MVEVAAPVKDSLLNVLGLGPLRDGLAYLAGGFLVAAAALTDGRRVRRQGPGKASAGAL